MPFGGFDSFEDCVDTMSQKADVDDPDAVCGALKAKYEKAAAGEKVWVTREEMQGLCAPCAAEMAHKNLAKVELGAIAPLLKGGKRGALRKLFEGLADVLGDEHDLVRGGEQIADAIEKVAGQDGRERFERQIPILKADEEHRLVYGIVYEPDAYDAHEDRMSKAEIERAAHGFMVRYAKALGQTGTDHKHDVSRDQVTVVESYIAPADLLIGAQLVKAGSWVMVAKVHDDSIWKDVKTGRYTGWSFEGWGRRVPAAA